MKRIIIFIALLLFVFNAISQNPTFEWVAGSMKVSTGYIATDKDGNIYTTGTFTGTVDFDPDTGKYNLSATTQDIFISKIDANGHLVWVKKAGGTGYSGGNSISLDTIGNIFVAGVFGGNVDFDPGAATFTLKATGNYDLFILKLSPTGQFGWARQIGNTNDENLISVCTDMKGYVYATGSYKGTCDFDPGPLTENLISTGYEDAFILKLDLNGGYMWAGSVGGANGTDVGRSIVPDGFGNICIAGEFFDLVDLDPGVNDYAVKGAGSTDVFTLMLDGFGKLKWAKKFGGTDLDLCSRITADAKGNISVCGSFRGTSDFDPESGTYVLTSKGNYDGYIFKLDKDGKFQWATQIGGTLQDNTNYIVSDVSGNLYAIGTFLGTADFDSDSMAIVNITAKGKQDIFIMKITAAGKFEWANGFGGIDTDQGYSVAVTPRGYIYSHGYYIGPVDFDPDSSTFNLIGSGRFIHKMSLCPAHANPVNITNQANSIICYGRTASLSASGNGKLTWYYNPFESAPIGNGPTYRTLPLTVDITYYVQDSTCQAGILRIPVKVIVQPSISHNTSIIGSKTISPNEPGASIRWMDCTSKTLLPDTGYMFTATKNGSYAALITKYGCTDTSDCVEIKSFSVFQSLLPNPISVYPNPNNGNFVIKVPDAGIYKIINQLGQCVRILDNSSGNDNIINIYGLNSGVYFITGVYGNEAIAKKIIVIQTP